MVIPVHPSTFIVEPPAPVALFSGSGGWAFALTVVVIALSFVLGRFLGREDQRDK